MTPQHLATDPRWTGRKRWMAAAALASLSMAAIAPTDTLAASKKSKAASSSPVASSGAAVPLGETPGSASPSTSGTLGHTGEARTYTLSMKDLGVLKTMQLRGVEGSQSVPFNIRSDEVVVSAKLRMYYSYSPSLIERLSHIKVQVNEETIHSLPVPKEQAGMRLYRELTLPAKVMSEYNKLQFQLIGHYTLDCEDPAHSSLWANIGPETELELTVIPAAMANNLAFLPRPFFDPKDHRLVTLPFVLTTATNPAMLESAGIIASWFGSLADYRGARFPTTDKQIPAKGNAVIMVMGNTRIDGVDMPAINGPTISMATHPSDPQGKLLIVAGRDAAELKSAATALAIGATGLSGPVAQISKMVEVKPRKPYDAPRWLPSDRPVRFGELAEANALAVSGYYPDLVRINLRMPPDLFAWRITKEVPIHLKYRYSQPMRPDKSTLNVNMNNEFLRMMPLRAKTHEEPGPFMNMLNKITPSWMAFKMADEEYFGVPLYKFKPLTQMQYHYFFDILKEGACKDVLLDNVRGNIDPDSTIDISGFPHFKAMPDLAAFVNAGFPFSRMADLSETAVLLPEGNNLHEVSTYLTMMGRIGSSTGLPATGVQVAMGSSADGLSDKDLLVIGTTKNQALMSTWGDALPMRLEGQSKGYQFSDYIYRFFNWWRDPIKGRDLPVRNQMAFNSSSKDAAIAGFESPLKSGRSVVMIASNASEGLEQFNDVLLNLELLPKIQGAMTIIRGKQVEAVSAEESYNIGRMNPVIYLYWRLSNNPLMLGVFALISAAIVAGLVYLVLKARARARLKAKA